MTYFGQKCSKLLKNWFRLEFKPQQLDNSLNKPTRINYHNLMTWLPKSVESVHKLRRHEAINEISTIFVISKLWQAVAECAAMVEYWA
jgi:hypothetical protein